MVLSANATNNNDNRQQIMIELKGNLLVVTNITVKAPLGLSHRERYCKVCVR